MENNKAAEEIAFIKGVIQESRKTSFVSGAEYILWGVIVSVGLIGTYILIMQQVYQLITPLWIIIMCAGWGFEIFYNVKNKGKRQSRTFITKALNALWAGTGVSIMIVAAVGLFIDNSLSYFVSPIVSVILGTAYYVTGCLLEYKWFRNISFVWWAAGLYFFMSRSSLNLLIFALLLLVFQAGSGLILNKKSADDNE